MIEATIKIFIFCLGASIGSFLNVCIFRLVKKESIVSPGSHCPHCKHPIRWYDNIPALSYLFLRGRCRDCAKPISFRYVVVELLTASMFLILFYRYDMTMFFWVYAALSASLIVVSFIDIDIREIPDEISISGVVIALILSVIFPQLHGASTRTLALGYSVLGILVGGGSIFITGIIGDAIFKKETMGGGDVKLMAMIGGLIGWKLALLTFFIAPFFGAIVGIILKVRKGESFIPYGPFLSLACFLSIFFGEKIINWLFLL